MMAILAACDRPAPGPAAVPPAPVTNVSEAAPADPPETAPATVPEAAPEVVPEEAPETPEPEAASSAPASPAKETPAREIATFHVPDLDAGLATKMAQALASKPGVIKAKPEIPEKLFSVVFTAPDATPAAIHEVLRTVSAETTLKGVRPDDSSAHTKSGCSGCPLKGKCSKKRTPE